MPSLAAVPPRPSAIVFPSRIPRPSRRLLLLPPIRFPPPSRLGFSVCSSSQSGRRRGRCGRRGGGSVDEDDLLPLPPPTCFLQKEIYKFTEHSANLKLFPTKQQLDAGRAELVEAKVTQGGWFLDDNDDDDVLGGIIPAPPQASVESDPALVKSNLVSFPAPVESDTAQAPAPVESNLVPSPAPVESDLAQAPVPVESDRDQAPSTVESNLASSPAPAESDLDQAPSTVEIPLEDSKIWQQGPHAGDAGSTVPDSVVPSSSERSMEKEDGGESTGVEGILARLEKERRQSYSSKPRGKGSGRQVSERTDKHDPGDKDVTDMRSSTPDMWRKSSLQRAGFHASDFKADDPSEGRKEIEENVTSNVLADDKMPKAAHNVMETDDGRNVPREMSKSQIHMRLQHLAAMLNSVRNLLGSRSKGINSRKGQESSLKEMQRLSDAVEFRETEIMNARDQLRSTQAKLAALEGKRTHRIIEEQKLMPEKQRRLDASQKSFFLLHTTCIVWANSASEVLLAGSFDGWTSQRMMKRSPLGVFSLCLDLYPGRYELKFIVDGVWTVDPLRPIVRNNGHENNLLVVT